MTSRTGTEPGSRYGQGGRRVKRGWRVSRVHRPIGSPSFGSS